MSLCLTRAELQELSGRARRGAIVRWLKASAIPFYLDADGWPKVLRTSLDRNARQPQASEPQLRLQ